MSVTKATAHRALSIAQRRRGDAHVAYVASRAGRARFEVGDRFAGQCAVERVLNAVVAEADRKRPA
jgi:hypothetical protein